MPTSGPNASTCRCERLPPSRRRAREFFRPFELCVFGGGLPTAFRQTLLARSLRTPQAAVLTCPPAWRPLSRVLVLNHRRRPGDAFLDTVASLCRTFQVVPVVLTVGRTESAARTWERAAEEAFAARGLAADFDLMAGCDAPTAVAHAARWRRCSHVFVERRAAPPWRRWLCGDVMRELANLSDSLSMVAFAGETLCG